MPILCLWYYLTRNRTGMCHSQNKSNNNYLLFLSCIRIISFSLSIQLLLVEICENLRRSYDRVASAQHEMNEELNRKKTEAAQSCIK